MKKIYLAISDRQEKQKINSILEKKLNLTVNDIKNQSLTSVMKNDNLELLIVDEEYIKDVDLIPIDQLCGYVLYVNPNISSKEIWEQSKLVVFKNWNDVSTWVLRQSNRIIPNNSKQQVEKKTQSDRKTESDLARENETIVDDLANNGEAVSLQPYPEELDEKIKQEIIESAKNEIVYRGSTNLGEDDEILNRIRKGRIETFLGKSWKGKKAIGLWSPLKRTGITTICMNLAIYLGKRDFKVAVIEGLKPNRVLKSRVKRFGTKPEGWRSFVQTVQPNIDVPTDSFSWIDKGVFWFPLEIADLVSFDFPMLKQYIGNAGLCDVAFIDLATGIMEEETLDSLHCIDELWIVSNGLELEIAEYTDYINHIKKILKEVKIEAKLIINKANPSTKSERIGERLNLPILAEIPNIGEEIHKNIYKPKPLIEEGYALRKLEKPFQEISNSLFGINKRTFLLKIKDIFNR